MEKKLVKQAEKSKNDERLIELLNQYRHNWLNDLQVLFAYIKLKKYDKLEHNVEKIMEKLEQESMISKLDIPSLVMFFIANQMNPYAFDLKIDLQPGLKLSVVPLEDEIISEIIQSIVTSIQQAAKSNSEGNNRLVIRMESQSDHILIRWEYRGSYALEPFIEELEIKQKKWNALNDVQIQYIAKEMSANVDCFLHFRT